MTYNDSKVAALALSLILDGVKILEGVNVINDNEKCALWMHSLEYSVGNIAHELTHPDEYKVGSELIGLAKNVIEKLGKDVGERKAIRIATLECLEYLVDLAKAEEKTSQISKEDELERKLNEQNFFYKEFLRERGIVKEYTEFVSKKKKIEK